MKAVTDSFSIAYEEHNQTIVFSGSIRPRNRQDLLEPIKMLMEVAETVSGTLYMDFKKLSKINNTGFKELVAYLGWIKSNKPDLQVKIITTSVVAWSHRKFSLLANMSPSFFLEQYDKDFYPGQSAIENESFIPVLRTQTKIIWQKEEKILKDHGLKPGMRIADICCGIGDFAVLVYKAYAPAELVAIDHAKSSLQYARQVAKEFGISAIDYIYGDAAHLLLEDNRFDFVTCRLSLQIFDQPERILKELYRICKPGGRVYLTNETYSKCFGDPNTESVSWTYREASRLFANFGMNLEFGTKMNRYLQESGFAALKIEPMIITNLDCPGEDFAAVIQSWEDYVVEELAVDEGRDEDYCKKLRQGFQDHIRAVMHPKGFGGWPIWVASGTKPLS